MRRWLVRGYDVLLDAEDVVRRMVEGACQDGLDKGWEGPRRDKITYNTQK